MKTWWQGLNTRERVLVMGAGALSLIILVWQVLLVPTLRAKADAKADLISASQQLDRALEGYAQKRFSGSLEAQTTTLRPAISAEAFKGTITREASAKGLAITRLQGDRDDMATIVFENASPQQLFLWLQAVESNLGGQVTRMTMEQTGAGRVRASVDIVRVSG